MEDTGVSYTVSLKLGQGYNSYIQEPRIDNAVTITRTAQVTPDKAASASTSSESTTTTTNKGPANVPRESPNGAVIQQALTDWLAAADRSRSPSGGDNAKPRVLPYRLNLEASARNNQTVTFSSKQVRNKLELDNAMGFNASAAIKATSLGPSAEVGCNLATKEDLMTNDVNFLVHVKVVNEAQESQDEWKFNEVSSLEQILQSADDNRAGKEHAKSVEFTRIYGDSFISDFVWGGEIFAWIGIRTQDRTKVKDLGAQASAKLTPLAAPVEVSFEAKAEKKESTALEQATTSIRIQWRGGGEIKNFEYAWDLDNLVKIANAFPSMVAVAPAKIRAVITPYSALKSFQDKRKEKTYIPLPLNYDHCVIYTSTLYEDFMAFQGLCQDLNTMIKDPNRFRNRTRPEDIRSAPEEPKQNATISRLDPQQEDDGTENDRLVSLIDLKAVIGGNPSCGKVPTMDPDPYQLSMMRLLCRSSMVYIQERAAELVIDPDKAITKYKVEAGPGSVQKRSDEKQPHFAPPRYICPGIIQSILPVPFYDSSYESNADMRDLDCPKFITDHPNSYFCDTFGDYLSNYKSYEHFTIGNFDPGNHEFPFEISIQPFHSRWGKHVSRKINDSQHAIAGIGLKYKDRPNLRHNLRIAEDTILRRVLKSGEQNMIGSCTMLAGMEPDSAARWKPTESHSTAPAINFIKGCYQPGSGRVASLEFYQQDYSAEGADNVDAAQQKPILVRGQWVAEALNPLPGDVIDKYAIPGDDSNISDDEADASWMFAGLIGAFEKVGLLKQGRVLAKVAVVWKRR